MTGRRLAVCAAVALMLGACSGGDDAESGTTLSAPVTDVTTTTTMATVPPPTVPEPTEPAPETSPPTLPGEPTTTESPAPPDDDQIKQDVIDATIASWTALNEALLNPGDDGKVAELALTRTGAALESAVGLIVEDRAENRRSLTHPEFPARIDVLAESATVDPSGEMASVEICRLGSNVYVEMAGNPDGSDRVINDEVNTYLETVELLRINDQWFDAGGVVLEVVEGDIGCG